MTLGGLAAAVGLVIDDAIVVVENIVMHRDSGQSRAEAIRSAIREIRVPLVGSTITPIVVFLPLISITGVTGVFFRALAVTVGVALLTSLALALTWTPTLSHYFIRKQSRATRRGTVPAALMRVYERALALHAGASAGAGGLRAGADRRQLPLLHAHRAATCCPPWTKAASSWTTSCRPALRWRRPTRDHPRGRDSAQDAGSGEHVAPHRPATGPGAVTEANTGDISVKLKRDRKRSGEEVIAEVRAKIKKAEPVLDVEFPQLLQDMIGDLTSAPEPVVIKLFCAGSRAAARWAPAGGRRDQEDPRRGGRAGRDREHDQRTGHVFNVDPAVAARAGFTRRKWNWMRARCCRASRRRRRWW